MRLRLGLGWWAQEWKRMGCSGLVDECFVVPAKAQSDREAKVNIGGMVVFLETDLSCIVIATAVVD